MATGRKQPADLHVEDVEWVREKKLLRKEDYIELDGNMMIAVYCKRCGMKIQGMMPDGRKPKVFKEGGKIREQFFVRIGPLPMYTEVEIVCDDGSKHVSPCCKNCAPFLTEDEIDAFLIADTDEEIREMNRFGHPMTEKLLQSRVTRRLDRGGKK